MLTAYAAGYEVWGELLMREPAPLHQKGWHPTAVRGAVAAAAACAKLRRLGAQDTSTALAIAGSMAGGLVANFGSLTKCFQVGRAAQSGVIAARLAQAGMTASPDALEHRSGFLSAFSPGGRPDLSRSLDAGRKEWHLVAQGLNLKRYPICYASHRAIDAAVELATRHDLKPASRWRTGLDRGDADADAAQRAAANGIRSQVQHAVRHGVVAGGKECRSCPVESTILSGAPLGSSR